MRVLFVQTAHPLHDDRVWYHQRRTLLNSGDEVEVFSTCGETSLLRKICSVRRVVKTYRADVILADTPFAVLLSGRRSKLVWDITEYYPSKKDLHGYGIRRKWQQFIKQYLARRAARRCTAFIYGEQDKMAPYQNLSKPQLYLPYYPSLDYVSYVPAQAMTNHCRILYAGPQTTDKGWDNVCAAIQLCKEKMSNVDWQLDTIQGIPFLDFCKRLPDYDLFLDLRRIDEENTHCVPIKLFYYMAVGRPAVYSRLEAIEQTIPEIESCITLVQPDDYEQVAKAMMRYIQQPSDYIHNCEQSRHLFLSRFNWELISTSMIDFLHAL